jgi:hypothetical protein
MAVIPKALEVVGTAYMGSWEMPWRTLSFLEMVAT